MALCSYDEAYTIPSEKAAVISLRTMQILLDEMGLRDTVDPMAGSYYIESLTCELEKRICDMMGKVDKKGGIVKAVANGYIQNEVAKQAFLLEKGIQEGKIVKVGVNKYREEEEEREIEFHDYKAEEAQKQIKRLNKVKKERDDSKVSKALKALKKAAESDDNLMDTVIDAVRSYATVGEITATMKEVYGEFKEPVRL
jgi:methylmalonyl-CoA mutase N-terminal domain/subunit